MPRRRRGRPRRRAGGRSGPGAGAPGRRARGTSATRPRGPRAVPRPCPRHRRPAARSRPRHRDGHRASHGRGRLRPRRRCRCPRACPARSRSARAHRPTGTISILAIGDARYIWEPSAEVVERARATAFMREHGIADWRELITRSQDDIEWFWDAVVRHLGIEFSTPYERVLDSSRGPAWPRWFTGGKINLTANCVDRHAPHAPERPAVVWESEDGQHETVTYARARGRGEPARERAARARRRAAATPSASILPMSIQVVAGFFAIAKIGAIVVPIFSGFAAPAVAARLADAGAVALLTADAVPRRGRPVAMKAIADAGAWPRCRRCARWWCGRGCGTDPPMQARPRPPLGRARPPPEPRAACAGARSRDADDGDLHLGHHRAAEGGRARPRRLPGQDRRGVRVPARRRHRTTASCG